MTDKSDNEGGFVGRWSRMKREAARAPDDARERLPAEADSARISDEALEELAHKQASDELSTEERELLANREAAEAVDIDSLEYGSDFSVFLKKGVPSALRRRAMRKLWTSNPVLANLDGLNDYDEDFADKSLNRFSSLWQVGRGYLTEDASDAPGTDEGGESTIAEADSRQDETAPAAPPPEEARPPAAPAETADPVGTAGQDAHDCAAADEDGKEPPRRVSLRRRVFGDDG